MREYSVFWEIDISAETPLDAAKLARQYQLAPDSTATVFDVRDKVSGIAVKVDLMEDQNHG